MTHVREHCRHWTKENTDIRSQYYETFVLFMWTL